jgi:hypothetical protein
MTTTMTLTTMVAAYGAMLALHAPAAHAQAATPAGVVHTSKHYELTTHGAIATADAAELLQVAEQLHAKLLKHFRAKPVLRRGQPLMQIKMWATRDGFRTNALADGVPESLLGAGGVYWTGTRRAYFYRQPSRYKTRHLWLHELTHQFQYHAVLNNGRHNVPGWYMEGIAEFFAYHHWDGTTLECGQSDIICLERGIPELTAQAKQGKFDPVAILAGKTKSDYESAWALVHYFLKGADRATLKLFRAMEPKIWKGAQKSWAPKTLGRGNPARLGTQISGWMAGVRTTWKLDWKMWEAIGDIHDGGAIAGDSNVVGVMRTHGHCSDDTAAISAAVEIGAGRAGVCAGYDSTNDFVVFDCTAAGKARLVRRQGGKWHTLAHATVQPGKRPVLKLTIAPDGTCTAYVNGTQAITKKLNSVRVRGHCALLIEGGRSRFFDVVLPALEYR